MAIEERLSYKDDLVIISDYLDTLQDAESETANYFAEQLLADGPLADYVAIIPVSAHQESSNIYRALSQYARQETEEPFTVYLGLNSPEPISHPEVQKSFAELERARHDFPHLDIRDTYMRYFDSPIGEIRRDLWNGVTTAALATKSNRDVVNTYGFNHDIDLVKLNRSYIANVQRFTHVKRQLYDSIGGEGVVQPPFHTRAKHAYDPQHPNISKGVFWEDFLVRQSETFNGYEASLVFALGHHAAIGGFDPAARTHETKRLTENAPRQFLRSASLETSPRRYTERLTNHGFAGIWTPDTFTPNDACRGDLSSIPDMTMAQLERHILTELPENFTWYVLRSAFEIAYEKTDPTILDDGEHDAAFKHTAEIEVARKLTLTKDILRRVIGSPALIEFLERSYDPHQIVEDSFDTS